MQYGLFRYIHKLSASNVYEIYSWLYVFACVDEFVGACMYLPFNMHMYTDV
jgi:hypothetical protein